VAFSWKVAKKRAVKHLKARKEVLLKIGDNQGAEKVKRRIERLQKDG